MKPLFRGYIHQAAFYLAIAVCGLLIYLSYGGVATIAALIYSITLVGLYGISSLYHCRMWNPRAYYLMKRIDHAAIFALIAGTATPICLIGMDKQTGVKLLLLLWCVAIIGMLLAIFWGHAPKWIRSGLYVVAGWFSIPYFFDVEAAIGMMNAELLITGGVIYTLGAVVYASKRPNPAPTIFGYHEIFHVLVVIASAFHFIVIYRLVT